MKNKNSISICDIKPGMILAENIMYKGRMLLSKGMVIKNSYVDYLKAANIHKIDVYVEKSQCSEFIINPVEHFYEETYKEVKNLICNIKESGCTDISYVLKIVNKIIHAIYSNKDFLLLLTGFGCICDYYYAHSLDVCIYSIMTAKSMNMDLDEIAMIGTGALLHDIGKTKIPDSILLKPDTLTFDEFEVIKKHSLYGYEIACNISKINPRAAEIVLQHHERCNGSGYPFGLKNDKISIYSKLVSIADIYDALTSHRVYRKKILTHEAAEYLLCISNTLIDKEIAKAFLENIAIYPKGCQVLLSTNEIAIVIDSNKNMPLRPILKVITDRYGNPLELPFIFDLQIYLNVFIVYIFN